MGRVGGGGMRGIKQGGALPTKLAGHMIICKPKE